MEHVGMNLPANVVEIRLELVALSVRIIYARTGGA